MESVRSDEVYGNEKPTDWCGANGLDLSYGGSGTESRADCLILEAKDFAFPLSLSRQFVGLLCEMYR